MLHSSSSIASGIRGFTPIKGRERRLKGSSESSSKSKSTGSSGRSIEVTLYDNGEFKNCSGSRTLCNRFVDNCLDSNNKSIVFRNGNEEDDSTSTGKSSSKSSSKRVRRLSKTTPTTATSQSKSASSSKSFASRLFMTSKNVEDCDGYVLVKKYVNSPSSSSSTSTSTSTSKNSRRE
eukprot:scaffold13715_cov149-Skeletonema_marinoi.AAC.3